MIKDLKRLFSFNTWANQEVIRNLKSISAPKRSAELLAHILSAEELWWSRIQGAKPAIAVWPNLTLEETERMSKQMSERWRQLLEDSDDSKLDTKVAYTNSKGEPWSSRLEDILLHVAMHSTYHRGQIAADVRAAGYTPAYTDFIHSVRQGFVE